MSAAARTGPPLSTAAGHDQPSLRYAWYVVIVLMVCYTLSFIDRQILSLLVAPMKRDLGISDTRVGLLQGLAFALFYTIVGLPLGRIADSRSRRNLVSLGVFLWSLMTALCAGAQSFGMLFLARMGVGVGEATLAPGAFSLIADYFPKEKLGRAMSLYSMGVFIGAGLALIVGGSVVQMTATMPAVDIPVLGNIASWRFTFLMVGAPGLLVALWTMTIREPARKNVLLKSDGTPSQLSPRQAIEQVRVRWQSVLGISVGMVFHAMCTYSFNAWGPAYFQRVHHWTPGETGRSLGSIMLVCGCLGMYVGGTLADRWAKQGLREAHLKIGVICGIGQLLFFVPAMLVPNPQVALVLLAPGIFFLALPLGTAYAALQMVLPNQARGQITALFIFILNLGGLTLGPLMPGVFNDYLFEDPNMVGASVAISIAIGATTLATIFRSIYSPYRRHHAEMEVLTAKPAAV